MRSAFEGADFGKRARYWDSFFEDRTDEVQFWARIAAEHGKRVLVPMAATGEIAVGLAQLGFDVLAIECCSNLIKRTRERGKGIPTFECMEGHLIDISLEGLEFDFVLFASGDYHYFQDDDEREATLQSVHRLLKPSGGFGLELMPFDPNRPSHCDEEFDPTRQPDDGSHLHIRSFSEWDLSARKLAMHQVLTIVDENTTTEITSHVPVPLYTRSDIRMHLAECGFRAVKEYGDYHRTPYTHRSKKWIITAQKAPGC